MAAGVVRPPDQHAFACSGPCVELLGALPGKPLHARMTLFNAIAGWALSAVTVSVKAVSFTHLTLTPSDIV